MMEQVSPGE